MTRPAPNQLPLFSGPAPAPQWRRQGNPLFESKEPLPLERVAGEAAAVRRAAPALTLAEATQEPIR